MKALKVNGQDQAAMTRASGSLINHKNATSVVAHLVLLSFMRGFQKS
jgi:hypothetical protein